MNKSIIRKKIFQLRKRNYSKNLFIEPERILNFLQKKMNNKIIGGYYPYNYEIDTLDILKKLEKKICNFTPQNNQKKKNEFLSVVV